jgi:hypothetical protein
MKTPQLKLLIKEIITQLILEGILKENVSVSIDTLRRLKRAYNKAVKEKKESFIFDGQELLVEYAKHLIDHLSNKLLKEISPSSKITIEKICPSCKKKSSVTVEKADYERWRAGTVIQNAFPYLSNDEREVLQSGICPICWDKLFKDI